METDAMPARGHQLNKNFVAEPGNRKRIMYIHEIKFALVSMWLGEVHIRVNELHFSNMNSVKSNLLAHHHKFHRNAMLRLRSRVM